MPIPELSLADPEYHAITGPLFHYTTIDAAKSIFESKSLWATNALYLNDAREIELGLSLLRRTVRQLLPTSEAHQRGFLEHLLKWLDVDLMRSAAVYVVCFSEARNQLSQWRGYSRHGRGLSIGFDCGRLIERMQAVGWMFHTCVYGGESQQGYVNAILTRLLREAGAAVDGDRKDHFDQIIGKNLKDILQVMASIKDREFVEEREVRFMSPTINAGDPALKFRAGNYTLIPYVEFELVGNQADILEVPEIIVGPSPNEQLTLAAVRSLAHQKGVVPRSLALSNVPYREL